MQRTEVKGILNPFLKRKQYALIPAEKGVLLFPLVSIAFRFQAL
jgi:hypothetical protein